MSVIQRVVLDTSTLVSAALRVGSVPHQALSKALGSCELCASAATLAELEQVLKRKKFDRYLDAETRLSFVALIHRHSHLFAVQDADELAVQPACRDPKDHKFLALALICEADVLISSDNDLLVLHPWRDVQVLMPAVFLDSHTSELGRAWEKTQQDLAAGRYVKESAQAHLKRLTTMPEEGKKKQKGRGKP